MVITIFSPDGGVGKTTIALSIAQALGEQGLTCLLEMDFSPGDIAVLTDIDLKPLTDTVNNSTQLSIQRPGKANFDVLTGGYPDTGENIDYDAAVRLIDDLRKQYQNIVIDSQSHLTANVVAALLAADTIVLPVLDEISSVAKSAGMIEYLENNKYADMQKAVTVVNKTERKDKYVSAAKLPVPVICHIPALSNIRGFSDNRVKNELSPLIGKWVKKPQKRGWGK